MKSNRLHTLLLSVAALFALQMPARGLECSLKAVDNLPLVQKACRILEEELRNRTVVAGLELDEIVIGIESSMEYSCLTELAATGPEGFKICFDGKRAIVAGHDARGVLFGVGKLLRMGKADNLSSTPANPYRPTNYNPNPRFQNQTDPQALALFDSHVRDIALFGGNGVQLLRQTPPEWVEIVKSYGLDVWIITYDNADPQEFRSPSGVKNQLDFRRKLIGRLPAIDHYIMKSGDPGDLQIEDFFNFSSLEAKVLHNYFPEAKIWVVPQHYKDAPEEYFTKACEKAADSEWLHGLVAGCWTRLTAEEIRSRIPARLHLIQGPDITHIYSDMYPARNMDPALARSLGRICIHIAPATQKHNHNLADKFCEGSAVYSEGTTDDLHKCLWVALDWNPEADAEELVREYARLFLPGVDEERYARGVMAIEKNATGPLESSEGMLDCLSDWNAMEKEAAAGVKDNPKFLMPLLRANFDAYIYKRWMRDLPVEKKCYDLLAAASGNPSKTMGQVRGALRQTEVCVDKDLKARCLDLYHRLYKDKERWMIENQPNMLISQMDLPLIDSGYISEELDRIGRIPGKKETLAALRDLGNRFRSVPGVVYFNMGDFSTENVTGIDAGWQWDPAYLKHPFRGFGCAAKRFTIDGMKMSGGYAPRAWLVQAGMYYDQPMKLVFPGLEPGASYKLRVAYTGEIARSRVQVKLTQNGKVVHRPILIATEVEGEWPLPFPASDEGSIELEWKPNYGCRGVGVAEVVFIRQ